MLCLSVTLRRLPKIGLSTTLPLGMVKEVEDKYLSLRFATVNPLTVPVSTSHRAKPRPESGVPMRSSTVLFCTALEVVTHEPHVVLFGGRTRACPLPPVPAFIVMVILDGDMIIEKS